MIFQCDCLRPTVIVRLRQENGFVFLSNDFDDLSTLIPTNIVDFSHLSKKSINCTATNHSNEFVVTLDVHEGNQARSNEISYSN